jgi:hypothetical protein
MAKRTTKGEFLGNCNRLATRACDTHGVPGPDLAPSGAGHTPTGPAA